MHKQPAGCHLRPAKRVVLSGRFSIWPRILIIIKISETTVSRDECIALYEIVTAKIKDYKFSQCCSESKYCFNCFEKLKTLSTLR